MNHDRHDRYGRIPYVHSTSEYPFSPVMVKDRYPVESRGHVVTVTNP
jgi:hypothetical protein